jgi:hypothetical protein
MQNDLFLQHLFTDHYTENKMASTQTGMKSTRTNENSIVLYFLTPQFCSEFNKSTVQKLLDKHSQPCMHTAFQMYKLVNTSALRDLPQLCRKAICKGTYEKRQ